MGKKADAYGQFGDAAVLDLLVTMLPKLVAEAAAPMGSIDKITVISTDGASDLTKSVATNVTQGMQLASDLLGIDLGSMFQRLANGDRTALTPPPAPPVATTDGGIRSGFRSPVRPESGPRTSAAAGGGQAVAGGVGGHRRGAGARAEQLGHQVLAGGDGRVLRRVSGRPARREALDDGVVVAVVEEGHRPAVVRPVGAGGPAAAPGAASSASGRSSTAP